MTIDRANEYFAALPEGFAPAEELRAALPAAAQQVARLSHSSASK